jgi:glyoxylase-like metal-dependent hydrolase (beta-lactamase superfamily II)
LHRIAAATSRLAARAERSIVVSKEEAMEHAKEVVPGIFQLKVPIPDNPLGYLNSYLFKAEDGCLLVDTGWNTDEAFGALARQLGEADVSFSDLKYIAITHVHPDHYGLVGRLRHHTKAELVIHEIERTFLDSRYVHYESLLEEMDQWLRINGVPEEARPQMQRASLSILGLVWVSMPDRPVRGGEHLQVGDFDLEVVWTPGHSRGHICFYERKRGVLVSGDHVLPVITPNVSMHTQSMGNPLVDYIDALRAVEELPVEVVLPAHEHVFGDLPKRAGEIRAHHEERQQHIIEAFGGEPKTAYQIAAVIPWATLGVKWEDLPAFHKRAAVTETLSHLELMRAEGTLTKTLKDGLVWYAVGRR